MNWLRAYILNLTAAALFVTIVLRLLPKGNVRGIAGFMGMLMVILAVFAPTAHISTLEADKVLDTFGVHADQITKDVQMHNKELLSENISVQCQSYILDKAAQMGLSLQVEVTLDETGDYLVPTAIRIIGIYSELQKEELSGYIQANLGISVGKQEWINRDG